MTWRVEFDRATAFVGGPKADARRRVAACGDADPIWVQRRGAWATSPSIASRVVDQLEARRIPVVVDHADQVCFDLSETVPANMPPTVPQEGLW
jgi:hypothetical protein